MPLCFCKHSLFRDVCLYIDHEGRPVYHNDVTFYRQKIMGENRFVLPDDRYCGFPLLPFLMLRNLFRASYSPLPLWFRNQDGKHNNNSCSISISSLNILRIIQIFTCCAAFCIAKLLGRPAWSVIGERCGVISFQGKA